MENQPVVGSPVPDVPAAVVTAKKVKKPKQKKEPKPKAVGKAEGKGGTEPKGIGQLAKKLILKNRDWTNEKLAEAVRKAKSSNTTASCIAWYKSKMRLLGELK